MKKVNFEYVVADAAGNMTAFIIHPVDPRLRVAYGKGIMESLKDKYTIEQVGFITPSYDGYALRMDMMGNEFCGNATRSYGYYIAKSQGLKGKNEVEVYVSGHKGPLYVNVDMDNETAEVAMPRARKIAIVEINGVDYKAVVFDGIVHVVVEGREDEKLAHTLLEEIQTVYESEAYGVVFFDDVTSVMVPYVYVKDADTLFREGSCASGTAAVGTVVTREFDGNDLKLELHEPSGDLQIHAVRDDDNEFTINIGGKVSVTEKEEIIFDVPNEAYSFVKEAKDKISEQYIKEKNN